MEEQIADFVRLLYSPMRYSNMDKIREYYALCRDNTFSLDKVRGILKATGDYPFNINECPTTSENTLTLLKNSKDRDEALRLFECIESLIVSISLRSRVTGELAKTWEYYRRN